MPTSPETGAKFMSDAFYSTLCVLGRPAFWVSSKPLVLHPERARRTGPFLVAANHTSPYDIPLLMRHIPRRLDFVSITEVFRNPFVAWLYGSMNAFPLDRSKSDPKTVRKILDRLEKGRVVAMFPEGGFCNETNSVFATRMIRPGIGRIAQLANVSILPVVLHNTAAYSRFTAWLPLRHTVYAVVVGEPIPPGEPDHVEAQLVDCLCALRTEIMSVPTVS